MAAEVMQPIDLADIQQDAMSVNPANNFYLDDSFRIRTLQLRKLSRSV